MLRFRALSALLTTCRIKKRTGNVSVGTSIFAMLVLEKEITELIREVDNVATPDGSPVAMVHANNCSSDLNAQIAIFTDFARRLGQNIDVNKIFEVLFEAADHGDPDCGGVNVVPYYSGEFITQIEEGRPLLARKENANYNLNNLMRAHLNAAFCALRIGFDILDKRNHIEIERLVGHGGLFKSGATAQTIMANALKAPVTVMETAGEGGAYGIALLASFMGRKQTLVDFLNNEVFLKSKGAVVKPQKELEDGFDCYLEMHKQCLDVENYAVKLFQILIIYFITSYFMKANKGKGDL